MVKSPKMRAAGFQNVGGDVVLALRGNQKPLNPNPPKRGGSGVGREVPVRGQVLPPDHEFAVLCTMPCCGSACLCTAVSGTPRGPSCSLESEFEIQSIVKLERPREA